MGEPPRLLGAFGISRDDARIRGIGPRVPVCKGSRAARDDDLRPGNVIALMKPPFSLFSRRCQAKGCRPHPVVEPLEDRIAPAATLNATITGGNLAIADIDGIGKDDQLTIKLVNSGASLEITDAVEVFDGVPATTPASTLSNGGRTLTIPFSAVTGSITINTLGGNDTATLDLSGGDFINAGGVEFNGGNPTTGPGDRLVILGGAQGTVTYNFTNGHDGSVVMSNFGTVRYTGLEPITNDGTATDVIFNLPGTNDLAFLEDNGATPTDGMLRLRSTTATFEQTDFAVPSNSLTINLGAGNDTLTLSAAPQFTGGLTINGGTGDDTINLNAAITFAANKNLDVNLQDDDSTPGVDIITSSSASNLVLSGTGAAVLKASKNIQLAGRLAAENGNITLEANQQAVASSGNFVGVNVLGTSVTENTGTGVINILGRGGNDAAGAQYGFRTNTGALVRGGTTGDAVTITGTGGVSGGNGIFIPNGSVRSIGGNILFTGIGTGTGTGITIQNSGIVSPIGSGNVVLDATTATPTSAVAAFNLFTIATNPTGVFTSGGGITVIADSLTISTTNNFSFLDATAAGTVTLRPKTNGTNIALGNTGGIAQAGVLDLSDAELDRVVAGTLRIGHANSGAITITNVISPAAYQTLAIGKAVSFTTGATTGGFDSDVFSATNFEKITAAGVVTIDPAATLSVTAQGGFVPQVDDSFTIIENTTATTTTGTFSGKPEGTVVPLGGVNKRLSYVFGAGSNDVVLIGTAVSVAIGTTSSVVESSGAGLVYTFTRVGDTTAALAINFTKGGTATQTSDYTASSNATTFNFTAGTLTIPAGASSVTVTVIPVDDRLVEADETATLTVASGSGYGASGSPATGTITGNDTATLSFTTSTSTSLESAGTHNVSTTLTINAIGAGPIGLASNLTANLTTTGGTATGSGTDYTLPGSPAVTFLAGTYATGTATQLGAITVIDDRQVEGDETAALGLSIVQNIGTQVSVGGTSAHTLTLTDNDTATLGFTTGTSTALESAGTQNVNTTLTINAIGTGTIGLASNLTANLTTTGGTATGSGTDYTLPGSPAVTFAAGTYATGTATQNAAVTVNDDRQVEGSETAQLGLAILTNISTQASLGGTTAHTLTLTDNDTATLGFTLGTSTALESAGTRNVNTTLTINAIGTGTIGLASNLTANVTTTGGTATGSGTDYTLPGSPAVTFAAGTYATGAATQSAAVTIIDDRLVEGDETAALGLSIVQNIGTQVSLAGTTTHTLTLTDNDTATVALSAPGTTAEGGGLAVELFTLTLTTNGTGTVELANPVTINITDLGTGTATGSGTDYTFSDSTSVSFASGATSGATQTASFVSINNDLCVEGTETVNLSAAIGSGPATISGSNTLTRTITDNETASIGFATAASSVSENAGSDPIGVVLTITGDGTGTAKLERDVTFQVTTVAGGTATGGGVDYTLPTAFTFNAGSLDQATKTADLAITNESDYEEDETAVLGLSIESDGTGGQVSVATGSAANHTTTITNDDAVPGISIADTSVIEGNSGTANAVFTVSLSTASFQTVTVSYATANGSAIAPGDYAPLTGQLTFAPGETLKTIEIAVLGEALYELGLNETFVVNLTTPGHATLGDAQAAGTITNDDAAPTNTFAISKTQPFTFFDANHDKVTVKLSGTGAGVVSLVGDVVDGTDISEIHLTGTDLKSALSVTVAKDKTTGDGVVGIGEVTVAGALKSFSGKAADLSVAGFTATGAVKTITAHNLLSGEIITGGTTTDKLALTLGAVSTGTLIDTPETISALKALSIGAASLKAAAFGGINVTAGALAADVTSVGAIAKITVKGGGLSSEMRAASFGSVSVKSGDFNGSLTSLTPAATLDKIAALKSLTITDGDLTGDVRVLGKAGAISVKAKKAGPGGSVIGASLVASQIASLNVAKNFTSSVVLAGADLGADHALGGGDDSFLAGSIGPVKISGNVSGMSVIGAGLSSADATFKDGDDTVLGGVASVIKSFTIAGTADPDSYFAAGLFKATPKIAGAKIDPTNDGRFKVG
jgi:hypothetical protein